MPALALARPGLTEGFPVHTAVINLPRVGAWSAELEVDTAFLELTGKVDLLVGEQVFRGAIVRGGLAEGVFRARIVGGAGGLSSPVAPRHYTSPTLGLVLGDIARDAGEAVSPQTSAGILATQLAHWTSLRLPAAQVIRCLMEFAPADAVWRILPDGTLWVGIDAFADSGITEFTEVAQSPNLGLVEVALVDAYLLPGTKLGDRKVDAAEIIVTAERVRAKIWTV